MVSAAGVVVKSSKAPDVMADHAELVAEMPMVEKMPIADRLKLAKKRRTAQLKGLAQFEKQSSKEKDRKSKKTAASAKRIAHQLRFSDEILLLDAAAKNDLDEVRNLLDAGACPDCSNEDGLTVLHQCCIDGQTEMMKLLLDHKANVNARDSELWTPLHAAATCGHLDLCRLLITHGADLLAVNADGNMAYDLCDDVPTLEYIETEMSQRGVTQDQIDETRLLTETTMLADMQNIVNDGGDFEIRGPSGETPMHVAACNGYMGVLEFLLSHGAIISSLDNDGWQPLHCAVCWGQVEAIRLLLEHGADADATTRMGETALDLCDDDEAMRQVVLNLLDGIQHKRLSDLHGGTAERHTSSVRRGSAGSIGAHGVIRRPSLHEKEKDAMSAKDARDEALHVLEMMAAASRTDEDDDDDDESMQPETAKSITADDNCNILPSTPEPVATVAASPLAEENPPPATLEIAAASSSVTPTSSVVEVPAALDSAAEEPASNTSPPTAGIESPTYAVVVKTSEDATPTDGVRRPEPPTAQRESVVPTATGRPPVTPALLDVKRQRQQARERQKRMLLLPATSSNAAGGGGGAVAPLSVNTNGAVTNGVDNASPHRAADSTSYIGTRPKYSNRYDIAAPDKKDPCCVVM